MTLSAMLFLRLQIKIKANGNISSMAHSTMGSSAAEVVDILFALLYYSLLIAYLKAFMQIISNAYPNMPRLMNAGLTTAFFGGCIFFKKQGINKVNVTLVFGLKDVIISVVGSAHSFSPPTFSSNNRPSSLLRPPFEDATQWMLNSVWARAWLPGDGIVGESSELFNILPEMVDLNHAGGRGMRFSFGK